METQNRDEIIYIIETKYTSESNQECLINITHQQQKNVKNNCLQKNFQLKKKNITV